MNNTLKQIIASREDISDYLFHFTKGKNGFDTLLQILADGKLKDINNRGFICFTESPLTALYNMFQIFERYDEPMYAPYGIGVKKDYLYEMGCRPVIYGTNDDLSMLNDRLKWRFEEYIPNKKDYTWLREWRLPKRDLVFIQTEYLVITKASAEGVSLMEDSGGDFDFDGDVADGNFYGYVTGDFIRIHKSVSMEEIRDICFLSKHKLADLLTQMDVGKTETISLGWFQQ